MSSLTFRTIHGGPEFEDPVVITAAVKSAIAGVSAFAPLHNRAELEGIEIIEKLLGAVPEVAVFDTGFHKKMPLSAAVYPGPYEWLAAEFVVMVFTVSTMSIALDAPRSCCAGIRIISRLLTCHLGNGCSLAAIREGSSVDTTMGFTPLEGLMMGTRSGSGGSRNSHLPDAAKSSYRGATRSPFE